MMQGTPNGSPPSATTFGSSRHRSVSVLLTVSAGRVLGRPGHEDIVDEEPVVTDQASAGELEPGRRGLPEQRRADVRGK